MSIELQHNLRVSGYQLYLFIGKLFTKETNMVQLFITITTTLEMLKNRSPNKLSLGEPVLYLFTLYSYSYFNVNFWIYCIRNLTLIQLLEKLQLMLLVIFFKYWADEQKYSLILNYLYYIICASDTLSQIFNLTSTLLLLASSKVEYNIMRNEFLF